MEVGRIVQAGIVELPVGMRVSGERVDVRAGQGPEGGTLDVGGWIEGAAGPFVLAPVVEAYGGGMVQHEVGVGGRRASEDDEGEEMHLGVIFTRWKRMWVGKAAGFYAEEYKAREKLRWLNDKKGQAHHQEVSRTQEI